jgi:hypothetical protein
VGQRRVGQRRVGDDGERRREPGRIAAPAPRRYTALSITSAPARSAGAP